MKNSTYQFLVVVTSILTICVLTIPINDVQGLRYSTDSSLSLADASFYGEIDAEESGYSVAVVGDVNGDGYNDIMIGSNQYSSQKNKIDGRAYLIFGKPNGWEQHTNLWSADVIFQGASYHDNDIGSSLSKIGDINGDGIDDVVLSSARSADNGKNSGAVFVFFGKTTGWTKFVNISTADAIFVGRPGEEIGSKVTNAGDVNGDGYVDFLVSNNNCTHSAYLVLGKKDGWSKKTILADVGTAFSPETFKYNWCYYEAAGVGDVNGDGLDDFMIAFLDYNGPGLGPEVGKFYLFLGRHSNWPSEINLSKANASFIGEGGMTSRHMDRPVAAAGDVNGDGYDDILIGAANFNTDNGNGPIGGRVYLLFGSKDGWSINDSLNSKAGAILNGPRNYNFGSGLAGLGDVNNDGFDDFAIGADSGGVSFTGGVYLFLGGTSGWSKNMDTSKAVASFLGDIPNEDEFVGCSVDGGDVNGDGHPDLLIGAYGGSDDFHSGETFLIFPVLDQKPPGQISLRPKTDRMQAIEDRLFLQSYSVDSENLTAWEFSTNAAWLTWNDAARIVYGMPSYNDVGQYWYHVHVKDGSNGTDEVNVTLTVKSTNHPPYNVKILSPWNGEVFSENEAKNITLRGTGSDLDKLDVLTYSWAVNGTTKAGGVESNIGLLPGNYTLTLNVNDGIASSEDTINITVTSKINPNGGKEDPDHGLPVTVMMAGSGIIVAVVALGAFLISDIGQFSTVMFLSPLYSKTRKEAILDNFTRGKIFQFIVDHPGTHFRRIRNELSLNVGVTTFHLKKLETEGLVKSQRIGLKKCFYQGDKNIPSVPSIEKQVLAMIRKNPGITQKELAKKLDISTSTIHDYIKRMRLINRIRTERNGRETRCYLVELEN